MNKLKEWLKSLSNTTRNIVCLLPFIVFAVLILVYAATEIMLLLILSILTFIIALIFLYANGQINKELQAYEKRKDFKPTRPKLSADIPDDEIKSRISHIDTLCELEEKWRTFLLPSERQEKEESLSYELALTEQKKELLLRLSKKAQSNAFASAPNITIGISKISLPLNTKVVGVTFEGRQQHLQDSSVGDELTIRHAPTNEYPNTFEVENDATGEVLGSLRSELADKLLDEYGEYCEFSGEITEITGGTQSKPTLGCNIVIIEHLA